MDKLQESAKKQLSTAEARLKLISRENEETLKLIDESRKLILYKSQQEAQGLKNQIEYLKLVSQNDMSLERLHEAFEDQISLTEKRWETMQEKKVHVEEAVNNLFKLWNLVLKNTTGEVEAVKSYFEFLCSGDGVITEEMLSKTAFHYKNSKYQKIAALNMSISELQKDKEAIVTKKEKLEEALKEKNRLETLLLDSRRMLEVSGQSSGSGLDMPVEKVKDEIDPVDDRDMVDNIKTEGSDDDCQEVSVQPAVEIIQIDDSSTEVSSYSVEGEAEVSSGVSTTQSDNVMGKTIRKYTRQLRTKCNQKQLSTFLSNLTAEKRRVMENSIFKAFLSIPPRSICLPLLQVLIENYNVNSDSFIIDKHAIRFCGKEVETCLGLENKGNLVDFTTRVGITPEIFQRYFGIKGKILKDDLMEKLKQMTVNKENADDFFRLSVYFMFSVYFFSTNDVFISYWPARYLESLEVFKSFNWARAIYEYLRESLRKTANEFAKNTTFISIKGCLPLLETLIYERIGSRYLKTEVDLNKVTLPCIIKYCKGDSRNPCTIRNVLAKVKLDKIKKCEDCSKEEATSPESAYTSGL